MVWTNPAWLRALAGLRRRLPEVGAPTSALVAALFVVAVDNRSLWRAIAGDGSVSLLDEPSLAAAVFVALTAFFTLAFSLFACKYLFRPLLVILLVAASANAYFMDVYGIVIDDDMLRNVVQTDAREASDLLTPALLGHVLLTGFLPASLLLLAPFRYRTLWRETLVRALTLLLAIGALVAAIAPQYKDFSLLVREHRELRYLVNPTYPLWALGKFALATAHAGETDLQPVGLDAARPGPLATAGRKSVVVVVVGETARAANFGLNGYGRDTTPQLAAAPEVLHFQDFTACGTSTAVSVPCMFSDLARDRFDPDRARYRENLLDVVSRAGVSVLWRENNSGCKGVCERVPTEGFDDQDNGELCGPDGCFDEVLLQGLRRRIREADGDVLIALHQQGSHGPAYYKRYPERFRTFTPECASNSPRQCPRRHIVNSYDNSIRYTDHVLARLVGLLRRDDDQYDSALLYVSDHGESLGENGLYLHGFPYAFAPDEQTRVPFVAWFSEGFRQAAGMGDACLRGLTDNRYSHDNLFHTVLGLFSVRTSVYRRGRDIFAPCRDAARFAAGGRTALRDS